MKVLEKTVTLGEKQFKIRTNRDIAVKSFEEFPEILEYIIKNQSRMDNLVSKGQKLDNSDLQFVVDTIKNKELSEILSIYDKFAELVKVSLPLMLKEAGDNSDANDIIQYSIDNYASKVFNNGIVEFLVQGFTQRELEQKPKIQFSMK